MPTSFDDHLRQKRSFHPLATIGPRWAFLWGRWRCILPCCIMDVESGV